MRTLPTFHRALGTVALLGTALFFAACKSDSPTGTTPQTTEKHKYVVLTNNPKDGSGFLNVYDSIPSGTINVAAGPNALQITKANGALQFGKYLYTNVNLTGEQGIQKFGLDSSGRLQSLGFITRTGPSALFTIVSDTKGYYWDQSRGNTKLQIFNPTTMARTGEVDLSAVTKGDPYESVGEGAIIPRDGKLFVDVHYAEDPANAYFHDKYDTAYMAVIDMATDKMESVTKKPGVRGLGYPSVYHHWDIDENGDIYIISISNIIVSDPNDRNSKLVRIRKGTTQLDQDFEIRVNDYQKGGFFTVGPVVRGGKIFIDYQDQAVATDFSNFNGDIYHYRTIDVNTKTSTLIPGVPAHNFTGRCPPVVIDGVIYASVVNTTTNSFYTLSESGGKLAFSISGGGTASGFYKLQ